MAITTSPDNIPSPTSGDPYNYVVDMAAMADRIQDIFTLRGNRPNPNLLYNSDFMVNQREAVSGATVANNAYFLDRWKNVSGAGSTLFTWADVSGLRTLTIGDAGVPRYGNQTLEQRDMPAGTYTLSWEGTATAESTSVVLPPTQRRQ